MRKMANQESLTHWRGKTVYRSCRCGETAFDAVYACIEGDAMHRFLYRCRNCRSIHLFRKETTHAAR
jgi:hypothetical protein